MAIAMLFVRHPRRPLARSANQHHVTKVDGALLLGNSTLDVALRIGAHVLLHHHDVLHQNFALRRHHAQHAAFLALVAPADHSDLVVTTNVYDLVHFSQTSGLFLATSH